MQYQSTFNLGFTLRNMIILIILVLGHFALAQTNSLRLASMGGIDLVVSDENRQFNLSQFGGNIAWLKTNDSLTWGQYGFNSLNEKGDLHRYWDAESKNLNAVTFSGQKHISESQLFYGSIKYNRDFFGNVHYAIERNPYESDPFVLSDFYIGNFVWYGPQLIMAFSQQIGSSLYLGVSLDYGIQQGLKTKNSRPEIVSRSISGSLDLAYRFTSELSAGISFRPFDRRDITELVTLPDGTEPITRRYRGEIKYDLTTSKEDRSAIYYGHEEALQLAWNGPVLEAAFSGGYRYLWHELFDSDTKHYYDGYYQADAWFLDFALRRHWERLNLALGYSYDYMTDWAKEPTAGFKIYQAEYKTHRATIGLAYQMESKPVLLAAEYMLESDTPNRQDFLGRQFRKGENVLREWRLGVEMNVDAPWRFRAGYKWQTFREHKIWDYYGNFEGPGFTSGFGYYGCNYQIEGVVSYQSNQRSRVNIMDRTVERDHWQFLAQLKQYF